MQPEKIEVQVKKVMITPNGEIKQVYINQGNTELHLTKEQAISLARVIIAKLGDEDAA